MAASPELQSGTASKKVFVAYSYRLYPGEDASNSVWTIAEHYGPGSYDSLGVSSDLGAGSQRGSMASWAQFEPSVGTYDWNVIRDRRTYVRDASQLGLDFVFIIPLGDAPPPVGVTQANFLNEWWWFCHRMGIVYGAAIYWWQLANELNSPHGPPTGITIDDPTEELVFNYCFDALNQAEGSMINGNQVFDHTWFYRSIVNAGTELPGVWCWTCDMDRWLRNAGDSIDVAATDPYGDDIWLDMLSLEALAEQYDKLSSIMETGAFSQSPCSEQCQSTWVQINVGFWILEMARDWNLAQHNNRYVLLGYYRQRDTPGPVTDTYGLLRLDETAKPAYSTFRT